LNARQRGHIENIDCNHAAPALRGIDALGRNLAPAPRRRAEIDDPRARLEQVMLVVDLNQLERGACTKSFLSRARNVRIIQLTLQPALGRWRPSCSHLQHVKNYSATSGAFLPITAGYLTQI